MGRFRETASFHRHLKNSELFSKPIKYANEKRIHYNLTTRKIKETSIVQIRNKYTKEIVDIDELVGTTIEKRNWRGIVIALLVIVTVLALIVTAIVLVTPKTLDEHVGSKISFQSFIRNEYEPRQFQPIWLPGEEVFIYQNHEGAIKEFNCLDNSSTVLFGNLTFRELNTDQFKLSADKQYVLFQYDIHHIYRHSTISKYKILHIQSGKKYDLAGPYAEEFQYVSWSPTGHSLVCIQYNDIFYRRDPIKGRFEQYTFDGFDDIDHIYNGVPDWVYEEEILSSDNALWFSPEGTYLLYAAFDDRDVYSYELSIYGDMAQTYVMSKILPYPKPGTPNPKVRLKIIDLKRNSTVEIDPPKPFRNKDHYFTTVSWQDETHVLISWMNRAQNLSILSMCDAMNGNCVQNYRIEGEGGWVDLYRPVMFKPDGSRYFLLLPHKDGSAGSFQHIAMIDSSYDISKKTGDGSKIFLTIGRWDVMDIVGYDDDLNLIYFIATKKGDPRVRHLYRTTTVKDHTDYRRVTCVSCDFDEGCQFVEASFTPTGKYYIMACKGPDVPSYHLFSTEDGFVTTLEDNADLKEKLEDVSMPVTEYIKIPIDEEQTDYMWAKVLLPPILRKDEIITYNILFKVYGGPGSQLVTEEFSIGWEHYLCSTHSVIIVFVDGRGTAGRGNKWLHANYKKLGTVEVEDTITAARYFNNLHYVNEQTAIWGLSYGGYLTSSVIGQGTDEFKCGLAVAPVTDWRYYDSVYTERYMGMPTAADNLGAYNLANVSKYASKFKSARFMVIHGTGDDNVHFQNTAQLIKALTEEDVYFRSQIYTDENHNLDGGNTKKHLYNTMEDFILQCYGKPTNFDELNDFSLEEEEKDVDGE
ncbi:dipeptidyl peptidase 4-like isoform X1 [Mercenaria mercenaria]|uniref:dipeptidyl peptidase 4-like isoform X1 n=1 Tax=Mercenaria mercenaria TaxID=6596 RepID=UPI00234EFDF8|nr:dipeptidyl peptidase 4-like isoform X1 [Mercenaria mercenaria]